VTLAVVLSLLFASCSSNTIVAGGSERPTPRPAPTIPGEVLEIEAQEVEAQVVFIGVSVQDTIDVHALPGLDQPLAGQVPPGAPLEPLGSAFQTEDGLTWWQVRAGDVQGWIQPNIAYQGPAEDITDEVLATAADTTYPTALVASTRVANSVAAKEGAAEVMAITRADTQTRGGTFTTDLLGVSDDAQVGFRLLITVDETSDGWVPISVFQFPLCTNGVASTGDCR